MSEDVVLLPILFILIGFVIWTIFSTIRREAAPPIGKMKVYGFAEVT